MGEKNKEMYIRSSSAEFLIFKMQSKEDGIQVRYNKDTIWITQKAMSELFDCSIDNISLHLKNIFNSKELNKEEVIEEYSTTATDNKKYKMKYYNLDVIIAVGYRINSLRATQFRRWATEIIKKFSI
ncbi:hypothetical protein D3C72_1478680 [compost metagenome]